MRWFRRAGGTAPTSSARGDRDHERSAGDARPADALSLAPQIASREQVIEALRSVFDPEFGMSVVDLGLIRDVEVDRGCVRIAMTLTTRACPLGDSLMKWAREAVANVAGVEQVSVALTFDPPWSPDQIALTMRP